MADGKDESKKTSEATTSAATVKKPAVKKPSSEETTEAASAAPAPTRERADAKKPRRARPQPLAAPVEEDPDALMTATLRAMEWSEKHKKSLAYAAAALVAGIGIVTGVMYYRAHREEQASAILARGVNAELAPIRTGDEDPEIAKRLKFYANEADKQNDALAAYKEAREKFGDTGPGILARLGEAGVNLDRKAWDEAIAGYEAVKGSGLAAADARVRLRCLEGLGYAREGKGLLDDARRSFEELSNLDVKEAKPLGLYHLARLDIAKGDNPAAINKLKAAREAVIAPGAPASRYLKDQVEKLLTRLDPTAVPKPAPTPGQIPGMPAGAGPGGKLTKEQIEAFLKSMNSKQPGGAPPPMPMPMPNAPTPNTPPPPPAPPAPAPPAPAGSK